MSAISTNSSMSIVFVALGSSASSSSGSISTYRSGVSSYPLTMSSNATSSPVDGSTRFCLIRAPVLDDNWWKRTVLGDVAEYILTGTLTRPKLIAPLQIARAMVGLYSEPGVSARAERRLATGTGERLASRGVHQPQ